MTTIAVLGTGKIGEALLSGLLDAGRSPDDLMFTERYPDRAAELEQTYRVRAVDNATAAGKADVLIVAVKPQDIDPLLADLAGLIRPSTSGGEPVRRAAHRALRAPASRRGASRAGDAEHSDAGR